MISPARHLTMNGHQSNQKAMKKIIIIASLIGGSLLLAGCQKEFGKGGEVRFVAASVAGPGTRAAYSGEGTTEGGLLTWERINWKEGDQIRIWSDGAATPSGDNYSDYRLKGVTKKSDTRSQATVENAAANGLNWDGVERACGFWALYPSSMSGTATGKTVNLSIADAQTPDDGLTNAPMVAAVENVAPNSAVTLEFYPAFTAFEITLASADQDITINSFALTSTSTALSGSYQAEILSGAKDDGNTKSVFTCPGRTDANGKVEFTFDPKPTITTSKSTTFTLLALPQDLTDLTLEFNVEIGGVAATRKLALKQDGKFITFNALSKHRIYGLAMPGNNWNFKYITLEGQVIDWKDVVVSGLDTDNLPEASQFVVNGANNGRYYTSGDQTQRVSGRNATDYRQYWLMKSATSDTPSTATVTFKIMAPEGGEYEVVPQGDTNKFTVTGSLTGNIAAKPASSTATSETTVVRLTITSTTTEADAVLYFKTYVTKNGKKYSIDSETQLYDLRGYHYFVMNNKDTVQ